MVPIKNIWSDITKIMEDDIRLINLISEPVPLVDIIDNILIEGIHIQ